MENQLALVGLAVMGQNFALNLANHGIRMAVYNRTEEVTKQFLREKNENNELPLEGFYSLSELVQSLERPRKIILLVKAGGAVDDLLKQLFPLLSPGDIVVDSGNSFFKDTDRRIEEAKRYQIRYLGMGISGGESGALLGPSLMPGGDFSAYQELLPLLKNASAQEPSPCINYMGEKSAGHYVKMVHNGIEYADMQIIAETYDLLKNLYHLTTEQMIDCFQFFQKTELNSYLIEITATILAQKDPLAEGYLVDQILDVAKGKGTGKWTIQEGAEQGVMVSMIHAALESRYLSSFRSLRLKLGREYQRTQNPPQFIRPLKEKELFEEVKGALLAAKILAYAQGLHLLAEASEHYQFKLNLSHITEVWRGGCIIRSTLLNDMSQYFKDYGHTHLLHSPYFKELLLRNIPNMRRLVISAQEAEIGVPAYAEALSHFDNLRRDQLPTNLLQAQRDFFGAHTYERRDRSGIFHTEWGSKQERSK